MELLHAQVDQAGVEGNSKCHLGRTANPENLKGHPMALLNFTVIYSGLRREMKIS